MRVEHKRTGILINKINILGKQPLVCFSLPLLAESPTSEKNQV